MGCFEGVLAFFVCFGVSCVLVFWCFGVLEGASLLVFLVVKVIHLKLIAP